MTNEIKELIWRRAGFRCEYCHLPQRGCDVEFEIDHVRARKHGGESNPDNLALSCIYCNGYKGTDLTGIDPAANQPELLFSPREDDWQQHFTWRGAEIVGKTGKARATIRTLKMNNPAAIELRASLMAAGMMHVE